MKKPFVAKVKWIVVCILLCYLYQVESLRDIRDLAPRNHTCDIAVMQAKYIRFEAVPCAVCGTAIALAFLLAIFGYRYYKAGMFLIAFTPASIAAFAISLSVSTLRIEYCAMIAFGSGIVIGLLIAFLPQLGLFVNGFVLGAIIGGCALIGVTELLPSYSFWIPIGTVSVTGLIGAGLSLKWQKVCMILASAAVAGAAATAGADYFVDNFTLIINAWERIAFGRVIPLCWYSWATLGLLPAFLILGSVIQLLCTGRDFEHDISGVHVRINRKSSAYKPKKYQHTPKEPKLRSSNNNHHHNGHHHSNNAHRSSNNGNRSSHNGNRSSNHEHRSSRDDNRNNRHSGHQKRHHRSNGHARAEGEVHVKESVINPVYEDTAAINTAVMNMTYFKHPQELPIKKAKRQQ